MSLDVSWAGGKLTNATFHIDITPFVSGREVEVMYDGRVIASFVSQPGAEVVVP